VEVVEIGGLLAELGLASREAAPIPGGWASWTFDIAGEHILRIARTDEIAAAHRREARLLPELADAVRFDVPRPLRVDRWNGYTYMLYRRLPGRPLQPGDDVDAVAPMLRQLHDFPVERAAALLGCAATAQSWHEDYGRAWDWVARDVLPVLDAALAERVRHGYRAFLDRPADFTPVLVHRDLGTEHLLVDPRTGVPTGVIDFETATVGDPAIDLVGLLWTFGEPATRRLIDRYGRPVSWPRLWFYHWMGSVHAIRHGVTTGDDTIVRDGIAGLRQRLPR
jgi:aminoglycoside 2''-phosphotransferase